ncbi:MAG: winged helix-turn-helix transcriptional regulator [Proteobacteria bacterium]|nr:winged helix-turn-helix transcriptional regulator [Pseudomonadota bacterium]
MRREPAEVATGNMAERKVGRTDPPVFMFPVLRTRVLDTLQTGAGLVAKVVSIVAPVGYGKTVLMSMLFADLRRLGKQCLWFGLDERDSTIDGVLGALGALLDNRESAQHPTQALFHGHDTLERRIDALLELIDRYPIPLTLFVDNLNYCKDVALGALLDKLIFQTRPSLQVVFSSTEALPLNVSRAFLEGLIRQVGTAELSFDREEVGGVLGAELCSRIGSQGQAEVARHTEGWPAAVRMAQIILSNTSQPLAALTGFSGSDEGLAHLLNRQVLSGFPAEVRDFLLCIGLLRTFSLDLCSHATGSERAGDDLAYLLQRNVFIIPLDRNRHWYRLHGLFREFLLDEAERVLPRERRRQVLRQAAAWCERNGYWREAIDYALDAGEARFACRILEQAAPGFVRDQGDLPQYIQWIERLHEGGQQAGPEAEYWFAWALSFRRRYEYARQQSVELEQRIQGEPGQPVDAGRRSALQRRIAILRTSIDSLTDRLEDAHRGAGEWLAEAGKGADDAFNIAAAHCIESCYFTNQFRFVQVRRSLQAARESAFQTNSAYVDGWVAAYAALISVYEGDYATAYPELVAALASARAALGDTSGIAGTLALIGAKCAIQMGLDAEARQLIQIGILSSRHHGFLEAASCGVEAALLLWQGEADDALAPGVLREAAACYPPRLALMLSCLLIRRLIGLGRKEEAIAEGLRIGLVCDPAGQPNPAPPTSTIAHLQELLDLAVIDLLAATGRLAQADTALAAEAFKARANGRMATLVDLELGRAALALRSDRGQMAVRHMTRAIGIAAPRRIVRPFADHADILAVLLTEKKLTAAGFALQEEQRFFAEICQRLPGDDPVARNELKAQPETPRLLSALTRREIELLGLVDAGLSNQQLADRTHVSLTTIKWHLQNLYRKLDVSSRSAALARARGLSLLR